jgi:hypothetical protein
MHQLISSMAELAKYHLTVLVQALLDWREAQINDVGSLKERLVYVIKIVHSLILSLSFFHILFCWLLLVQSDLTFFFSFVFSDGGGPQKVKVTKDLTLLEERNKVNLTPLTHAHAHAHTHTLPLAFLLFSFL